MDFFNGEFFNVWNDNDKFIDLITQCILEKGLTEDEFWELYAEHVEEHGFYYSSEYIDSIFLKMVEDGTFWGDYDSTYQNNSDDNQDSESNNSLFFIPNSNDDSNDDLFYNEVVSYDNLTPRLNDFQNESINHPKGWLYSFSENFFAYNYDINYFVNDNILFAELPYTKHKRYWIGGFKQEQFNFLTALVLDQIHILAILMLPFFNEFLKSFLNSVEFFTFLESHPEFYLIYKDYTLNNYFFYFSNYYTSLYSTNTKESFLTPVMVVFQFFFLFLLTIILFIVHFDYYGEYSSQENIIDHDYLIFNITIESEEEIGSLDDMLLGCVILLYVFLWFFWIHGWSSISIVPKLVMSVYLFPFIYFIIVFIPFSLLYDYGLYFLTYLNGVGKSIALIIELVFDYIAVAIFYLRLIVQNVRLAFMLFTFIELHELIIFYDVDKNIFPLNDSFPDSWDDVKIYSEFSTLFSIVCLPTLVIKWLYELFHTFFMVIFQFVAFFAMIFWLFLFLYSMFTSELQENYLSFKRIFRKEFFKNKINFKLKKLKMALSF